MDAERSERARRRAQWPGVVTTLEEQSDAAIVRHGTPAQRIAMVWRVTLDAWASARRAIPQYSRAEMPSRIVRAGEADDARGRR